MRAGRGELHRVLSKRSLESLAREFGAGRNIRIPRSTADAARFEKVLGLVQTSELVSNFGGTSVYIPGVRRRTFAKYGADLDPPLETVKALTEQGKSATDIARICHCSNRTVYNKRRRLRELPSEGVEYGREAERILGRPDARDIVENPSRE